MDPSARTRKLSSQVTSAEQRLERSVATGKSAEQTISVQINGRGVVKSIEIDASAFKLSDKQVEAVGEAMVQAIDGALSKQRRRVDRELDKLTNLDR